MRYVYMKRNTEVFFFILISFQIDWISIVFRIYLNSVIHCVYDNETKLTKN